MTPLEILTEARGLIYNIRNWAQGAYAYDGMRNSVPPTSLRAQRFCAIGAMLRVCNISSNDAAQEVKEYRKAKEFLYSALANRKDSMDGTIVGINDKSPNGHGDIIRLYDEAIALAKEAEEGSHVDPNIIE